MWIWQTFSNFFWITAHKNTLGSVYVTTKSPAARKHCCNLFYLSCFCPSLPSSDNIPNHTLPGSKSQYGIQSIFEPDGSRHWLDAWAATQYPSASPWESHQPDSHGQRHLHTKTYAYRQAGGMLPACSCFAMFGLSVVKGKWWLMHSITLPGLSWIPAR